MDKSSSKRVKIFISYTWNYGVSRQNLTIFFNEHADFSWVEFSVPEDDPVQDAEDDNELVNAIRNQIRHADCVLMLAGLFSSYSYWIQKEIEVASEELRKPIIAVQPWSAKRTSQLVKDHARHIVDWNSKSIVDAIRKVTS